MNYLIFALLMYATNVCAMNYQDATQKQFQEWLKNACGVTDLKKFMKNGDNDRNYPFCWAAIKAIEEMQKQQKINGKS